MTETVAYRASRKVQHAISNCSASISQRVSGVRADPWRCHFKEPNRSPRGLPKLSSVEGIKSGQRCIILGTAPSVREIDISRSSADYVMVLNKGYLLAERLGRVPDALAMNNPYAMTEYGDEAVSLDWRHVFLSQAIVNNCSVLTDKIVTFSQWETPRMNDGYFQFDSGKPLYHSGSIAHSALQIAVIMGFDEIILAGIDLDFKISDPHFYQSGDSEALRTMTVSQRNSAKMIEGLQVAKHKLECIGGPRVINAGKKNSANPFVYQPWDSLFPQ